MIGAALDYEHRLSEKLSAYGNAWAGTAVKSGSKLEYEALGGLRLRF